jgi:hypothetical protein
MTAQTYVVVMQRLMTVVCVKVEMSGWIVPGYVMVMQWLMIVDYAVDLIILMKMVCFLMEAVTVKAMYLTALVNVVVLRHLIVLVSVAAMRNWIYVVNVAVIILSGA